jgi:hypothetical protein
VEVTGGDVYAWGYRKKVIKGLSEKVCQKVKGDRTRTEGSSREEGNRNKTREQNTVPGTLPIQVRKEGVKLYPQFRGFCPLLP